MGTGSRFGFLISLAAIVALATPVAAQTDPHPLVFDPQSSLLVAAPPPATLLEGFRAPLGSIVTVGHELLGELRGISVEAREVRDSNGDRVRGVVIGVTPEKGARQLSYIDVDELAPLIHAIDQLLRVTSNPTQFNNFEMQYATKGELEVTASSSRNRGIVFSVEVGRLVKARQDELTAFEVQQLRTLIEAASQRLAAIR